MSGPSSASARAVAAGAAGAAAGAVAAAAGAADAAAASAAAGAARPAAARASAFFAAVAWHRHQLVVRPYVTNSVTSAALMVVGDRAAQAIEGRADALAEAARRPPGSAPPPPPPPLAWPSRESLVRTGVLTLWAAAVSAPFWTLWYRVLDKRLPGRPLVWVGLTATLPAPAWNVAFFSGVTALEHLALVPDALSPARVQELGARVRGKLEAHFLPTVTRSACVWVPVNTFSFLYVPKELRTTFGSSVGLLWNVFLSLVQHSPHDGEADAAGAAAGAAAAAPAAAAV